jgi:hypothetical protein
LNFLKDLNRATATGGPRGCGKELASLKVGPSSFPLLSKFLGVVVAARSLLSLCTPESPKRQKANLLSVIYIQN